MARSSRYLAIVIFSLLLVTQIAFAFTFTVTNTNDAGTGSLRQAITDANVTSGTDSIAFSIPTIDPGYDPITGAFTIQPNTGLPTITDPIVIDGTTQPGFVGQPIIELDGRNTNIYSQGLKITAGNSTVRGLVINRFNGTYACAIEITGNGDNTIEGNFIGTDVTGCFAATNAGWIVGQGFHTTYPGGGIYIENSSNNAIGGTTPSARNLISGNYNGIIIRSNTTNSTNNIVQGNFIGTDVTGTIALSNGYWFYYVPNDTVYFQGGNGVFVGFSSGNSIGGTSVGARNIISGNGIGINIAEGQNNCVEGNHIGTDVTGMNAVVNSAMPSGQTGIHIGASEGVAACVIGGTNSSARNIISGNWYGIHLCATSNGVTTGTKIQGNYIGTDVTGMNALPNVKGIFSEGYGVQGVLIGGTDSGSGNVIAGNSSCGIWIEGGRHNDIQGNYIGVDASGNAALGNSSGIALMKTFGASVGADSNIVGGTLAGTKNVLSGNQKYGVFINYGRDNQVLGNYIGTDDSGTNAIGNGMDGVAIVDGVNNMIGNATIGAGNVISGNQRCGIIISSSDVFWGDISYDNKVQGNWIGVKPYSLVPLGNVTAGVRIDEGYDNLIGGTQENEGNIIAYNDTAGVHITKGTGNAVLSNSIFANSGLGIDLDTFPGVTSNDLGDGDAGANDLQNFPVLTSAISHDHPLIVTGNLNSTPNMLFRLEFYANDYVDPSTHGEGQDFVGSASVLTDSGGNVDFTLTMPGSAPAGRFISATATDSLGNTSEFSECVEVTTGAFTQGVAGQTIYTSVALTENIGPADGPGIIIGADGVTLDGDGYKISGTGSDNGIVINGKNNVTVKNLFVLNYENGISMQGGAGNTISMNRLHENATGLSLSSTGTTVNNNIIADNNLGLEIGASGNNIYHNQFINNPQMIQDVGGNTWVDSLGILGNHWSNYWGLDDGSNGRIPDDGIGDTELPHEGIDNTPVMDPSMIAPFLAGDFLEVWGWLIWRGGWSPVEIQVTNPAGQTISFDEDEIGLDAFYAEYEEIQPGSKLVYVQIGLNPLYPYDGAYQFQMTGLDSLTYWMEWFASDQDGKMVDQSVADIPLANGETRNVEMVLATTIDSITGDTVITANQIVSLDIKPQSCPNALMVTGGGILPAAILGRPDFDVSDIDPVSIQLEGVAPQRYSFKDVATLITKVDSCDCTLDGADGFVDLNLKFDKREIVAALGAVTGGETPLLTITGTLLNGTPIEGQDCVVIMGSGGPQSWGEMLPPAEYGLTQNIPEPFRGHTAIKYQLPDRTRVNLRIYDAAGRLVNTLVNATKYPGYYTVYWNGKDGMGREAESGVYFYRLNAGDYTKTRKMVLVR